MEHLTDAEIYSSEYKRTLYSCDAHTKGLFPEHTGLEIPESMKHSHLLHPPMKSKDVTISHLEGTYAMKYGIGSSVIYTIPKDHDYMFNKNLKVTCPKLDRMAHDYFEAELKKSNEFDSVIDLGKEINKMYSSEKLFKQKTYNMNTLSYFFDALIAHYYLTGEVPNEKLKKDGPLWTKLIRFRAYAYIANYYMSDILRTKWTTGIMQRVLDVFDHKIKHGQSDRKKYLGFSGHEGNILVFLMKWGMTSLQCQLDVINALETNKEIPEKPCEVIPDFASNLIWELNRDTLTNEYYVKTLFNGKVIRETCYLPEEDGSCKYSDFKQFALKNYVLAKDVDDRHCKTPDSFSNMGDFGKGLSYSASIVAGIALGLILVVLVISLSCSVIYLLGKIEKLEKQNFLDINNGTGATQTPLVRGSGLNADDGL